MLFYPLKGTNKSKSIYKIDITFMSSNGKNKKIQISVCFIRLDLMFQHILKMFSANVGTKTYITYDTNINK